MEIYESEPDHELYNEALRQHLLQLFYIPPAYRELRNASSVNIYKLLGGSGSEVYEKPKCIHTTRNLNQSRLNPKESGDFINPPAHEVNYHKIIIEKCNRNKACMCKPIIKEPNSFDEPPAICNQTNTSTSSDNFKEVPKISKKCQKNPKKRTKDIKNQFHWVDTNTTTSSSLEPTYKEPPQKLILESKHVQAVSNKDFKDVKNQTSQPFVAANDRVCLCDDSDNSDDDACSINNDEQNMNNSRTRICVPCSFEDCLSMCYSQKDITKCSSLKQMCRSCCHVDIGTMCMQDESLQMALKTSSTKSVLDRMTSYENSSCSCENKKKCFCFRKKPNKDSSKLNREKCIQTRKMCCSDKCYQVSRTRHKLHVPTSNSNYTEASACPKHEKVTEKACKKCCKACTKNTIVLPPKPLLSSDQADTLKTLIKMEAKQNYRQVNIILQELNEQKTEIKKLLQLYQRLACPGKTIDTSFSAGNNGKNSFMECEPRRPHTVNICEGCGLHFYRGPNDASEIRTDKVIPFDTGDTIIIADDQSLDINGESKKPPKTPPKVKPRAETSKTKKSKQPKAETSEVLSESATPIKKKSQKGVIKSAKKQLPTTSGESVFSETISNKKKSKDIVTKPKKKQQKPIKSETPSENVSQDKIKSQDKVFKSRVYLSPELSACDVRSNSTKPCRPPKPLVFPKTESVLTLYSKDKQSIENAIPKLQKEVEKLTRDISTDTSNNASEKTIHFCKSKSKAFLEWCKKSFVQLTQKDSKRLRQCNTYLLNKLKECQEQCRTRSKKSIFTCISEYCKKKMM